MDIVQHHPQSFREVYHKASIIRQESIGKENYDVELYSPIPECYLGLLWATILQNIEEHAEHRFRKFSAPFLVLVADDLKLRTKTVNKTWEACRQNAMDMLDRRFHRLA
jgi:hypothetical protein